MQIVNGGRQSLSWNVMYSLNNANIDNIDNIERYSSRRKFLCQRLLKNNKNTNNNKYREDISQTKQFVNGVEKY